MRAHRLAIVAALVAGLTACKKSSPGSGGGDTTPDNEVAAPTCADVEVNVRAVMIGHGDITAEQVEQATELLVGSCVEDAWPAEAIDCAATAPADEFHECQSFLSDDLGSELEDALITIFSSDDHDDDYDDGEEPPEDP